MKPTREQCLEWLDEVAEPDRVSPWNAQRDFATITPAEIEALCQRVWNEAIESAAKNCDCNALPEYVGDNIRELKVKP